MSRRWSDVMRALKDKGFTADQITEIVDVFEARDEADRDLRRMHARERQRACRARKVTPVTNVTPVTVTASQPIENTVEVPPKPPASVESPPSSSLLPSLLTDSQEKKDSRRKKDSPSRRGEVCPLDFKPTQEHFTAGIRAGLSYDQILELAQDMIRWSHANANRDVARKANWNMTFFNWMKDNRSTKNGSRGPRAFQNDELSLSKAADRLIEQAERGEFTIRPRPSLEAPRGEDDFRLLPEG